MKEFKFLIALCFLLTSTMLLGQNQIQKCATDQVLEEYFQSNPQARIEFETNREEFRELVQKYKTENKKLTSVIIPTVVHLIHFNGNGNISDAQVKDGLRMINEDLKRQNADTTDTRSIFKPFAGSTDIEFRLAKKDPQGNCTDGIDRVNDASTNNFGGADVLSSRWPKNKYFNIWLVNKIENFTGGGGVILGYAYYPGSGGDRYGVVNRHDSWGSIGTVTYFGRTASHEVGHALNLPHTFDGSCGSNCSNSGDESCDTPPVNNSTQGCTPTQNTCSNDMQGPSPFSSDVVDQLENYMSYDDCQNMFSLDQVTRMETAVANDPTLVSISSVSNLIATGTDDAFYFSAPPCSPIANFTSDKKTNCENGQIKFSDLSFNSVLDSTWSWSWSFPGGMPATSNDQNPIISYPQAGNYPVTLITTNSSGSSNPETKTSYINIVNGSGNYIGPKITYFSPLEFPDNNADPSLAWQILNPSGGAITWSRNTNAFLSGPSSVALDNYNISNEQFHSLVSPVMDLTQMNDVYINFWLAYARRTNENEIMNISYSEDCGFSWKILKSELSIYLYSVPSQGNSPFIPSSPSEWRPYSLNVSNLAGKDDILIKIEFKSRGGNNIYIDDFEISESVISSLNEVTSSQNDIKIFPNPNKGVFTLAFSREQIGLQNNIIIYNTLGEIVFTQRLENQETELEVDLSQLQKGLYFIRTSGRNSNTKKLIIK